MRFRIGAIPEAPDFSPDAPWKSLREPTPWVAQFVVFPLAIVLGGLMAMLWFFLTPLEAEQLISPSVLLGSVAAIIPFHELIHAAIHPQAGRSAKSILGFWPSKMLFFAHYNGELSRSRFITILVMPLLIISGVPLIACVIADRSSAFLATSSILNALFAYGDIFGVVLLLFQVPADARVRNQGWRTFWRLRETKAA
jgi:hypothetical protein